MKLFKRLFGNATETENQSGESHDTEPIKPSPFARPTSDLEDTKPVQALIANEEALPLADQRTKDLKEAQHAYMLTRIALKSARDEDKRAKERWQESQANAKHMEQAISFELDAISESMISHDDFDEWMRTYSPVQDALLSVSAWTKVKGVIESSDEILDLHMVDRISHPILREPTL